MTPSSHFLSEIESHRSVVEKMAALEAPFAAMCQMITDCLDQGGKVMFFGNGGSAADAQHIATELTVRFQVNRRALAAIALTTDSSALTAIGNDFGFDDLFARQVEALGKPADVAIGISTSGKSPNVLKAFAAAKALGVQTVAWTGANGIAQADLADLSIDVPSTVTARIQEMHITIGHALCGVIDAHVS